MHQLGKSEVNVYPLCLGGNTFGWSSDQDESFAVLDAYVDAGGNFIDTADVYSEWNGTPGISETIIGNWMHSRGNRDQIVVATKFGSKSDRKGASAGNINAAVEESLQRLQTDYIDLYFAHRDFADVPLEETLIALDGLIQAGKVRVLGASNYAAGRLEEALKISEQHNLARYEVVQNHYNLMERPAYEDSVADVVAVNGLASVPYFSLAAGFLTGKYRPNTDVQSVRAGSAAEYLKQSRGPAVLAALDAIAETHTAPVSAVALAWLAQQPTVTAPIASARTPEQLADLIPMSRMQLSQSELQSLSDASAE